MLSFHAKQRSKQRGIPLAVIEFLWDYGAVEHRENGLDLLYLDKYGKNVAKRLGGRFGYKHLDRCLNVYLLENSDGKIVTVGHRAKRINRN